MGKVLEGLGVGRKNPQVSISTEHTAPLATKQEALWGIREEAEGPGEAQGEGDELATWNFSEGSSSWVTKGNRAEGMLGLMGSEVEFILRECSLKPKADFNLPMLHTAYIRQYNTVGWLLHVRIKYSVRTYSVISPRLSPRRKAVMRVLEPQVISCVIWTNHLSCLL